jgi:hypothetical protein
MANWSPETSSRVCHRGLLGSAMPSKMLMPASYIGLLEGRWPQARLMRAEAWHDAASLGDTTLL